MAAVLALGAFTAFVLPFLLPVSATPVYSTAWLGGADNRAATVGLAVLSCVVLMATVLHNRNAPAAPTHDSSGDRLTTSWLFPGAIFIALWTLFWGTAIVHSGLRIGETNYFLEQTRNAAGIGTTQPMRIYRDLEFPYGPLLLEPAVWLYRLLGRLGTSVGTCYVLTLTAWNVLGIGLVWFSLNRLPLRGWARRLLFAICLGETLHPLFGPNYSLGKFALPVAVLLWAAGVRGVVRRALAFAAGLFLVLMVSPELGVGLAAAIFVLSVASAVRYPLERSGWLLAITAIPVAYSSFLLIYGTTFLDRLRHASGGALNLIIQPMPDMLVFCFAVLWLAPVAVAMHLGRVRTVRTLNSAGNDLHHDHGPMLLAIFILALGLLPGALGRADPLHVFFNGLPFLILSMVAIDRLRPRYRLAWSAALILLALQVQAANYEMYARSLGTVLAARHHPLRPTLDVTLLAHETGGASVAAPVLYGIPIPDELALRQAHLLVLDPAPGLAEIWDAASEQNHIARLRQSNWALLPQGDYRVTERLARENHPIQGSLPHRFLQEAGHALLGFNYPERHPAFSVGVLTSQEIASNWLLVDRYGSLELYKRLR